MSHTSGVGRGYCYLLGSHIGNVDHYLLPIIAVIIVVSLIHLGVELPRSRAATGSGVIRSRHGTPRMLAAAVWACIAVLIAVAANQPIVHAAHEARPNTGHPHVLVLVARSADLSFPSDHCVMAGAAAAGLLLFSRKIGLVAVVAALLMAFARVYVGAHYPGDVLAGLLIGAAVAILGWLLVRVPLTRAARWARDQSRLQPLLVATTGHADVAAASGSDTRP